MNLPALHFSGTNLINFGSGTAIDNVCITKGTVLMVVWRDTWAAFTGGHLLCKDNNTRFNIQLGAGATPAFEMLIDRATADLRAGATALPIIAAQKWLAIATVFDTAGANGDQKLYTGDERSPIEEVSAYTIQSVGSGTVTDTSGFDLIVGNRLTGALPHLGKIAFVGMWPYRLSLAELRNQWDAIWLYLQGVNAQPLLWPGCVLASHIGRQGNVAALDVTGTNAAGVVTGCQTWEIDTQPQWAWSL